MACPRPSTAAGRSASEALYETLHSVSPTPIAELNRAVAVAMRDGPAACTS